MTGPARVSHGYHRRASRDRAGRDPARPNTERDDMPWHTAALISIGGLSWLAVERLAPPAAGGPVAVLVPPWQAGGMTLAGQVGLPVIDIAWGGRLVVFETTSDPEAIRGIGVLRFSASPSSLCGTEPNPERELSEP